MQERIAMIRRENFGCNLTSPQDYTTARSGSKVLILAENERGGYRAITIDIQDFWQWSGKVNGGDYAHLRKDSNLFSAKGQGFTPPLYERKLRNQTSRLGGRSRQRYSQGTDAENHLSIQSHRAAPV